MPSLTPPSNCLNESDWPARSWVTFSTFWQSLLDDNQTSTIRRRIKQLSDVWMWTLIFYSRRQSLTCIFGSLFESWCLLWWNWSCSHPGRGTTRIQSLFIQQAIHFDFFWSVSSSPSTSRISKYLHRIKVLGTLKKEHRMSQKLKGTWAEQ